ncbi:MAG: NERD domain-containing protein [Chloroflexota bacterium]|nr:NERD domain-containing protein [Chloroflexota bacterium]
MGRLFLSEGDLVTRRTALLLEEALPDDYFIVCGPVVWGEPLDVVVVAPQGLFVLYPKGWQGEIHPRLRGAWREQRATGEVIKHPNPARAARRAEKALKSFLEDEAPKGALEIRHYVVLEEPEVAVSVHGAIEPPVARLGELPDRIVGAPPLEKVTEGALEDVGDRESLALALRDKRLTATQRASQPFVFRPPGFLGLGGQAHTTRQLVRYMDRCPERGVEHLESGALAAWLSDEGAPYLAELAREVVSGTVIDGRAALERFVYGTGLVRRPRIRIRPRRVDLGYVVSGEMGSARLRVRKGFGRGYLYGRLRADAPWLRVEPSRLAGALDARIVADTESLVVTEEPAQSEIVLDCNAYEEPIDIPVRVNVVLEPAKAVQYILCPLLGLMAGALLGGVVGWALARWVLSEALWPALSSALPASRVWMALVGLGAALGTALGVRWRTEWPTAYAFLYGLGARLTRVREHVFGRDPEALLAHLGKGYRLSRAHLQKARKGVTSSAQGLGNVVARTAERVALAIAPTVEALRHRFREKRTAVGGDIAARVSDQEHERGPGARQKVNESLSGLGSSVGALRNVVGRAAGRVASAAEALHSKTRAKEVAASGETVAPVNAQWDVVGWESEAGALQKVKEALSELVPPAGGLREVVGPATERLTPTAEVIYDDIGEEEVVRRDEIGAPVNGQEHMAEGNSGTELGATDRAREDPRYREAMDAVQMGRWEEAIDGLTALSQAHPDSQEIRELLEETRFRAHVDDDTHVRGRRWVIPWRRPLLYLAIVAAIIFLGFVGARLYQRQFAPMLAQAREQAQRTALLQEANALRNAGSLDEAEARYRQLLKEVPEHEEALAGLEYISEQQELEALYETGVAAQESGDYETALRLFTDLSMRWPNYKDVGERIRRIKQMQRLDQLFSEAEAAESAGQYAEALALYQRIRSIDAAYKRETITQRLFDMNMNLGLAIVEANPPQEDQLPDAVAYFEQALALRPRDAEASRERSLAGTFLEGRDYYYQQQWEAAIVSLEQVYRERPGYLGGAVVPLLYKAYIASGDQHRAAEEYELAYDRYTRAARLPVDDTTLATRGIFTVRPFLTPTPTPTMTPTPTQTPKPTPTRPPTPVPTPRPMIAYHNKIVFYSDFQDQPGYWAMDATGGNRQYLGRSRSLRLQYEDLEKQQRYSPDERYFLFVRYAGRVEQIYVQTLETKDVRQLTKLGDTCYDPVWSPGGGRIVFVSQQDGSDDIWLMNADGSNAHNLTPNAWEWEKHPSWSPEGTRIAFWSNRTGMKQIYVMDANGSNVRNISNTDWAEYDPVWIP